MFDTQTMQARPTLCHLKNKKTTGFDSLISLWESQPLALAVPDLS